MSSLCLIWSTANKVHRGKQENRGSLSPDAAGGKLRAGLRFAPPRVDRKISDLSRKIPTLSDFLLVF
jgi:hypothetical protein